MKYIGKVFEYFTHNNEKRTATCRKIEFHHGLGKPVFIGVSPWGNEVSLTRDEISCFRK